MVDQYLWSFHSIVTSNKYITMSIPQKRHISILNLIYIIEKHLICREKNTFGVLLHPNLKEVKFKFLFYYSVKLIISVRKQWGIQYFINFYWILNAVTWFNFQNLALFCVLLRNHISMTVWPAPYVKWQDVQPDFVYKHFPTR